MKLQLEEADRNLVNRIQEKSLLETEKELTEKVEIKEFLLVFSNGLVLDMNKQKV